MKKNTKMIVAALLVVCAVILSLKMREAGTEPLWSVLGIEALSDSESGVICRCSTMMGQSCAVDNYGANCAPSGSAHCWEYNLNCHP